MYIGRFVVVGRTDQGTPFLGYRVSSRSFPNRRIALLADRAVVLPTADAAPTDNPYVAYNCFRTAGDIAVVANGSHVDSIVEKAAAGYPLRDALALPLLALDYEHDTYNTPRIAAAWDASAAHLAIVSAGGLLVQTFRPDPGQALLMATYERTAPTELCLAGRTAPELAWALHEAPYEHPIAAFAWVRGGDPDTAVSGPA
jgi:IMP cyclohydrolase